MTQDLSRLEILAKINDGSPIPSFVINKQHKIVYWNTAIANLTEQDKMEMVGTDGHWKTFYTKKRPTLADLIVDGASAYEIWEHYQDKCRKSELINGAYEAEDFFPDLGKNGKWIRFTASPIIDSDGSTLGAVETLEDISARKVAESNLRNYVQQITRAQEDERKRIARELHDDTAQIFGSLSRQVDNFIRKKHSLTSNDLLFLKDLQAQLNRGVVSVNRFVQGLRPPILDDLGLIPAVRSLVKNLQDYDGIDAKVVIFGKERRFASEVESLLYRIVQEALNNVRKHSHATDVQVILSITDYKIKITITDNGQGFELSEKLDNLPVSGKLGLTGMQERAHLMGGSIRITTRPGKGTTLVVDVPI